MDLIPPPAATPAQVRRLQIAFAELGYTGRTERSERLDVAASVLGLEHLASFGDLDRAQAGRLFACLRHGAIPAAGGPLPHEGFLRSVATEPEPRPEPGHDDALAELLTGFMFLIEFAATVWQIARAARARRCASAKNPDLTGPPAL